MRSLGGIGGARLPSWWGASGGGFESKVWPPVGPQGGRAHWAASRGARPALFFLRGLGGENLLVGPRWHHLSQRLFLERFVPEVVFGTICPRDCFFLIVVLGSMGWSFLYDFFNYLGFWEPKMNLKSLKIIKNHFKIDPVSLQNASWTARCIQKVSFNDFLRFFKFLEALGPPKIEPKSRKIEKKTEKIEIKKPHVF